MILHPARGRSSSSCKLGVLIAFLSNSTLDGKLPQCRQKTFLHFFPRAYSRHWHRVHTSLSYKSVFSSLSLDATESRRFRVKCYHILNSSEDACVVQGSIILPGLLLFLFISLSSIIISDFTQGPGQNLKVLYLSIRILAPSFFMTKWDPSVMKRLSSWHSRFRLSTNCKDIPDLFFIDLKWNQDMKGVTELISNEEQLTLH